MNILIIGNGAREHAIFKAFARSEKNPRIFCCGSAVNPGILAEYWVGDICHVPSVLAKAKEWQIDLAIIGPEAPLEKGLADAFIANDILVVGPQKKLAQLETSKSFTRELLKKYQIEGSPRYQIFQNANDAKNFLQELGEKNYVIKADGLMGGKGVKVAGDHLHSFQEAFSFCEWLEEHHHSFVIEEKLIGQEFSLLCFCDGEILIPMPLVQDHKRAFVNDLGPNTGGMGSYSDANHSLPFLTEKDFLQAMQINNAVMKALQNECGEKYRGILYSSFIATRDGVKLIEYNARFGDPEALNLLAILETDFVDVCEAIVSGTLSTLNIKFANRATVCKYAVPMGYPDQAEKYFPIDVSHIVDPKELYFGAVTHRNEKLFATGSRTIAYVGIADTIEAAEKIAETEINRVQGKLFHREDIGTKALIEKRCHAMHELRACIA